MKLILLHDKRYYIFLDFPEDEALGETGITFHRDKRGVPHLAEDEVKAFLEKQFKNQGIKVYSFWTA